MEVNKIPDNRVIIESLILSTEPIVKRLSRVYPRYSSKVVLAHSYQKLKEQGI